MKKIFLTMFVLVQSLLCFAADNTSARKFTHPGSIYSNEDIANVKKHVDAKEQPWLSEWDALVAAYGNADYVANGNTEIGGSGGNRQRACRDAWAAMYNAIIWRVRGSDANAQCAVRILNAWGSKCVSAKDELFQFPCLNMCIAAECLREESGIFYGGWAEADRNKFMNMVRNVFVPALRRQTYNRLPSWSAPAMAGLMAAGILLDDANIYAEALNDVMASNGTKSGNIYKAVGNNGQIWEMGRDNVHAMLCVDNLVRMAQMTWNQGDDLWAAGDNRILKGVDYWCGYNSGHTDLPWNVIPSAEDGNYRWFYVSKHDNAFRLRPDGANYELAFHHYKEVMNMDESNYPYLSRFTKLGRPECTYHTLMYTRSLETSPLTSEKPQKPLGIKAVACKGFNTILWNHAANDDARDYYVFRSMDGTTWNEIYHATYHTGNFINDYNVEEGCNYFYKVRFENYAGLGPMSDVCSCLVKEQGDSLADGWKVASVSGKIPASATYSNNNHGSFTLKGGGREIYYGDDGCGFLYYTMNGDGCITARIINCFGYQNGLMMRQSLSSGARMAALKLGGKGGRYLEMWNRVNTSDGKPTVLLGSDYTHTPFWMRLERKGNVFTSYVSRDGSVWEKVASQTLAMSTGDYYAGVFVCNDKNTTGGALTINVDNVSVVNGLQQKASAPSALKAEAKSCSRINLSWNKDDGADSYTIIRYNQNTNEGVMVAESLASTTFSDTHLDPNTSYRYAVMSENWSGMSVDTAFVEQSTLQPSMHTKPVVSVVQNTLNSAKVVWNGQEEAFSYSLYRSSSKDGAMELMADDLQDTSFVNNNLKSDSTYYYQLKAINSVGEVSSEVISVDIKKYSKLSSSYRMSDNALLVDFGHRVRGKCHFFVLKSLKNQSWKLIDAQVQVANSTDFENPINIGTINELVGKNYSAGIVTAVSDKYYRFLRILPKYSGLTAEDFNIQCYGDTIRLQVPKITFEDIPEKCCGAPDFNIIATSTSELPITFTSTDEAVATVSADGLVHIVGEGQCYIQANQAGDNVVWADAIIAKKRLIVTAAATGITTVSDRSQDIRSGVYDLQGRLVSSELHQGIPDGVYIFNGKKIIIRRVK